MTNTNPSKDRNVAYSVKGTEKTNSLGTKQSDTVTGQDRPAIPQWLTKVLDPPSISNLQQLFVNRKLNADEQSLKVQKGDHQVSSVIRELLDELRDATEKLRQSEE